MNALWFVLGMFVGFLVATVVYACLVVGAGDRRPHAEGSPLR